MIVSVLFTFIAVFLLVTAIFFAVTIVKESPSFALRMRLRRLALNKASEISLPDDLRSEILKETPPIERILNRFALFRSLDRKIDQAGLKIQPHVFLIFTVAAIIVTSTGLYIFFHRAVYSFLAALVIILATSAILQYKRTSRARKLTEQLPDVLMMIARSLRAGHSLNSAIELVGSESASPAGELFKTAFDQQKLGMRISDSLANMTDRIESLDLRFFIITVNINSEVGGNLAEVLDKLADTIRDRIKVRRQVQVYTAQGRYSGYVLAVLPIIMFIIINLLNPEYGMILIREKLGHYFLAIALIMQLIGYLVIRNIINIRI